MAKRKIKRNVKIYRRNKVKNGTSLKIIIVILIIIIGYLSAGPILEFIDKNFKDNNTTSSVATSSEKDDTSSDDKSSDDTSSDDKSSETSSKTPSASTSSKKESTSSEVKKEDIKLNATTMPNATLLKKDSWDSYLQKLVDDKYNRVIIELKNETGVVFYNTKMQVAVDRKAIHQNAINLADLYKAIEKKGLTPIASINTLKDRTVAHASQNNCYTYGTTKDVTWLDNAASSGGKAWLNPYMENARKYVVGLCDEIAKAGFETIILDTIQFPDGTMSQINMVNETCTKPEILKQLVDEVNSQIATSGAVAIPQVEVETYLAYKDTKYGGSPNLFADDSVVVKFDYDTLNKVKLPEAYKGKTLAKDYDEVIKKIFTDIKAKEIMLLTTENKKADTVKVLKGLGIDDILM